MNRQNNICPITSHLVALNVPDRNAPTNVAIEKETRKAIMAVFTIFIYLFLSAPHTAG